jgi:pyruvate kinase
MRRTKIICTYGPSINSEEMVEKVILAGANVIRFNFSHGDYDYHRQGMNNVKTVRERLGVPIAILMDTKGPEVRTKGQDEEQLSLESGEEIILDPGAEKSVPGVLAIDYRDLAKDVKEGMDILLDDGKCRLVVQEVTADDRLRCLIRQGGMVKARRSVNVPKGELSFEFLSKKDKNDLAFAAEMEVDVVAASFTRSPQDIKELRRHLFSCDGFTCDIVAKIENRQGVTNIKEICYVSDGVMVARGDLGVELPVEEVPHIQKKIIRTCRKHGKPVITATQMLESMLNSTYPTRAEVSDIANAIYDSTSAIMLSGETAAGDYPIECVEMMSKIAQRTEVDIDYKKLVTESTPNTSEGTHAMANAALSTANDLNASAIVALTSSGYCARLISRRRPGMGIIAPTNSKRSYLKMALYWGVSPLLVEEEMTGNLDEVLESITNLIEEKNLLPKGSLIVQLGGTPVGLSGSTNVLKISSVGNVACRGQSMVKGKTTGLVHRFKNKATTPEGRVLVMRYLMEADLGALKRAKALVLQGSQGEEFARVAGETLNIPVITRAEGAVLNLYDNEVVLVDGEEGIVYRNPEEV